jgi:hypothetical protein
MSDRIYRLFIGLVLLISLYFRLNVVVYGLILLAITEGITNLRVPIVVTRLRNNLGGQVPMRESLTVAQGRCKFDFEAERALRLMMAGFLILSFVVWPEYLWFIPWFIGFALFGAGVSGVCPSLSLLRWVGFR